MENPIQVDDLGGYRLFRNPPYTVGMEGAPLFNTPPLEPFEKGYIIHKYPLYHVYMGLIKGVSIYHPKSYPASFPMISTGS